MGCGASQADPPPQKARPPAPPQQQYAQQQYAQQQQQQQPRLVAVSPLQAPGYGYTAQQVVYVPHSSHAPPLSAQTPLERPREPMLLLDTTGSMVRKNYASGANNPTKRRDTVCEALRLLVPRLGEHDTAGEDEEDGGGLRTVTFADGEAHDIGDLSVSNLQQKFNAIRWAGGTYIMPGWRKLCDVYNEEFGGSPAADRPLVLACVLTDGEAADIAEFGNTLATLPPGVYVSVGIVGFGDEHDRALRSWMPLAATQQRVRIITLDAAGSNAAALASALEGMFRTPVSDFGWM